MGVSLTELCGAGETGITTFPNDPQAYDSLFGVTTEKSDTRKPTLISKGSIGPLSFTMRVSEEQRAVLLQALVLGDDARDEDGGEKIGEYYIDNFTTKDSELAIWAVDFLASGVVIHYHLSSDETKVNVATFACQRVPNEALVVEFICEHQDSDVKLRLTYRVVYTKEGEYGFVFDVFVDGEEEPRVELCQRTGAP